MKALLKKFFLTWVRQIARCKVAMQFVLQPAMRNKRFSVRGKAVKQRFSHCNMWNTENGTCDAMHFHSDFHPYCKWSENVAIACHMPIGLKNFFNRAFIRTIWGGGGALCLSMKAVRCLEKGFHLKQCSRIPGECSLDQLSAAGKQNWKEVTQSLRPYDRPKEELPKGQAPNKQTHIMMEYARKRSLFSPVL